MQFRKNGRGAGMSSAPRRPDTIQSVSGYKLRVQHISPTKVRVAFLDPDNRLLHRAIFKTEEWNRIR